MQSTTKHLSHPAYRPDIDGLRAIAVLSVVAFHAFPNLLRGGFIGVDIFFVISGFLISSILFANLERDQFTFAGFYSRRVRRIFPALAVVLVGCLAAGCLILLPDELQNLGVQIAGGAAFVSNFLLWNQSGYFDPQAESKPLLHLWSLAIEEQFYIFWPLLLAFFWKRGWGFWRVTLVVATLSLGISVYLVNTDGTAAFYSPASRYWELLVGATLAYVSLHKPQWQARHHDVQSWAGLALLMAGGALISEDRAFPGAWALLPTLGAALLISAGQAAWFNRTVLSSKVMVWFGLISYPLYLWHWPLLSFAHILEGAAPPKGERALAVAMAILLAWLTCKFIEKPLRFGRDTSWKTAGLVGLVALLGALGMGISWQGGLPGRPIAQSTAELESAKNDWHYENREFTQGRVDAINLRGTSPQRVLFLGDSFMSQYYPRVARLYANKGALPYFSTTFVARNGCRPVPDGELINSKNYDCDAYYRAVLNLARDPVYTRIVVSASWSRVFSEPTESRNLPKLVADLNALRELGKTLYVIAPGHNARLLNLDALASQARWHPLDPTPRIEASFWVDRASIEKQYPGLAGKVATLAQQTGAQLVEPIEQFCTLDKCPVIADHKPLFIDNFHLRASIVAERALFIDAILSR